MTKGAATLCMMLCATVIATRSAVAQLPSLGLAINDPVAAAIADRALPSRATAPIKIGPSTARDYIVSGILLMNQSNWRSAVAQFDRAIAIDPFASYAFGNRAFAHTRLFEWPEAESDAEHAIALDGSTNVAFDVRGLLAAHRGDYSAAINAFDRSIELSPRNLFAYLQRARALSSLGQIDNALTEAKWVAAQTNNECMPVELVVDILSGAGRREEALAYIDGRIPPRPDRSTRQAITQWRADILTIRAKLLVEMQRPTEAIVTYGRAIKMRPTVALLLARAELRAPLDRPAAFADIAAARKIDPTSGDVIRIHAWLLTQTGEFDAALRLIDEGLVQSPGDTNLLGSRAYAHEKLGRIDDALDDLDAARRANPDDAAIAEGQCQFKSQTRKRLDSALADCNAALNPDPLFARRLNIRGRLFLQLDRPADAARDYSASLSTTPRSAEALYGRGIALLRTGEVAAGQADVDAAKQIDADIGTLFDGYGIKP